MDGPRLLLERIEDSFRSKHTLWHDLQKDLQNGLPPSLRHAFLSVDRKQFLPEYSQQAAYENDWTVILKGETLRTTHGNTKPSMVAVMAYLLDMQNGIKVKQLKNLHFQKDI